MKAAYDVLKKPDQRQMYDSYGAGIVKAMNGEVPNGKMMGPIGTNRANVTNSKAIANQKIAANQQQSNIQPIYIPI